MAIAAILLAACGSDARSATTTTAASVTSAGSGSGTTTTKPVDLSTVSLNFGDQVNLLESLLDGSGQSKGIPYSIGWKEFTSGPPLMEALRAGAIDGGIVGETPPILEQAAGTKLKLIAAIQGDTSGSAIIVPKNSKITSVEELKGKKIAFAVGSAAETLLAQALAKNGLKLSDITPVDLQPGDALAAFGSGQVDAWVSWDPYTALAQASGAKTLITAPQAGNAGLSYLVVRADALSDPGKAAAFGDLIGRLAKAGVWRTTHEPEWVAKFVALTHLPAAIAKITIDRSQQHYVAIGAVVQKDQQAVADLLFDQGVVPKRLDESEVLDPRYNSVIASVLGTASAAK